jgi:5-deoxy-5-amino-3-dehydroquinate synthase
MSAQEWLEVMARDKKALDGLTFILDGPKGLETVSPVASESVVEALNRMANKS